MLACSQCLKDFYLFFPIWLIKTTEHPENQWLIEVLIRQITSKRDSKHRGACQPVPGSIVWHGYRRGSATVDGRHLSTSLTSASYQWRLHMNVTWLQLSVLLCINNNTLLKNFHIYLPLLALLSCIVNFMMLWMVGITLKYSLGLLWLYTKRAALNSPITQGRTH